MDRDAGRPRRTATFGSFTLDLEVGELRRGGEIVPLRPKPLQVLMRLVETAGKLTPRDELLGQVWGDVHLASDTVLHTAVGEIRQALGDDASHPRFVETVHRRGYRFCAPVHWGSDDAEVSPVGRNASVTVALFRWAAAAMIIAGLAGIAAVLATRPDGAAAPGAVEASAEVLRARYLVNHGTRLDIENGVARLRVAVRKPDADPLAWSGLAVGELRLGNHARARAAAERALILEPRSAEGTRVLGQVLMASGDYQGAERLLLTSLELDAGTGKAHYAYSVLLALSDRLQEALRMAETAAALAPRIPSVHMNVARLRYYAGDLEGAVRAALYVLELGEGGTAEATDTLQAARWLAGDMAGARDAAVHWVGELGASAEELGRFRDADAETGLRSALRWRLDALLRRGAPSRPETYIEVACLCIQLGDTECALEQLARLPEPERLDLPTRLHDPRLDAVRSQAGLLRFGPRARGGA